MAMDLAILIEDLKNSGQIRKAANNPLVQFGLKPREYLGATLLPERQVPENAFREENIRYRTIIANDGTRYSPVQRKKGELVGSFEVILGDSDIGREFTGREYDTLINLLGRGSDMQAMLRVINWVDVALVRSLAELAERHRWDAIINAQVIRKGNDNYRETVAFSNPAGHRVNALGTWSDDNYDPYEDIVAMVNLLTGKGFTVTRIITRRPVVSILTSNAKMRARIGLTTLIPGAVAGMAPGFIDLTALNGILSRDGLPPIQEYNLQYRTQNASQFFIPGNAMIFICETGRDESLDLGDLVPGKSRTIPSVLGYYAIGRPVGEPAPGKVVKLFPYEDKPPRIDGQAWQTSFPVITEPEAIGVIKNIS